jgi:hypothetical protein
VLERTVWMGCWSGGWDLKIGLDFNSHAGFGYSGMRTRSSYWNSGIVRPETNIWWWDSANTLFSYVAQGCNLHHSTRPHRQTRPEKEAAAKDMIMLAAWTYPNGCS